MKAEPRTEKKTMGKGVRGEGDLARAFLSKSTPKNLQLRRLANLPWLIVTRSCSPSYNLVPRAFPSKNGWGPGDEVDHLIKPADRLVLIKV